MPYKNKVKAGLSSGLFHFLPLIAASYSGWNRLHTQDAAHFADSESHKTGAQKIER